VSGRGEYRAIHRVLLDGPDFQELPERARWVFVVLKLNLGPSGLEVWYHGELAARLAAQTGAPVADVEDALVTLEGTGWIQRERHLVWIVGQLQHDPHVKQRDPKHRTMIQNHVAGLPRTPIVARFVLAHRDWFTVDGSATGAPVEGLAWAFEGPSEGHRSTETETEPKTEGAADAAAAPNEGRPPESSNADDPLPASLCNAAYEAWVARIGSVNFGRFRRALLPIYRTKSAPHPTLEQLRDAILVFDEARAHDQPRFRSSYTVEKWAGGLHEYVRLGAMPLVDEWGEPTERGKLTMGAAA
jgi:hypothetical protein